jgi:hypothetical protein
MSHPETGTVVAFRPRFISAPTSEQPVPFDLWAAGPALRPAAVVVDIAAIVAWYPKFNPREVAIWGRLLIAQGDREATFWWRQKISDFRRTMFGRGLSQSAVDDLTSAYRREVRRQVALLKKTHKTPAVWNIDGVLAAISVASTEPPRPKVRAEPATPASADDRLGMAGNG